MASVRTAQILSGLTRLPESAVSLPARLVQSCAKALPVSGVAIVLMTDQGPAGTVAATDGPAELMEELQFTLGEGPCVDSSRTGRPVLQPDLELTGGRRWPAFTAGAIQGGIGAIFALPLRVGGIRLGVLDLYRDRAGGLTRDELAEALSFADAATTVLLHLQARGPTDGMDRGSIRVTDDRAEVHQATGMVAVQVGVPLDQALVMLRARAFALESPIAELASQVLAGRLIFVDDSDDDVPVP